MNIDLLKKLGNPEQLAGIREARLVGGKADGVRVAEFHNAAGIRFTVVADRGMDIFDLSYKGINLSFQSKNGIVSPNLFSAVKDEFCNQWSAGAVVTCGLDNVGGYSTDGGNAPTHGRHGFTSAGYFGTDRRWENGDYVLEAKGEVNETSLFGRSLSLKRSITTSIFGKTIRIKDTITNNTDADEPYMLLYHCNFGYPLLDENSRFLCSSGEMSVLNGCAYNPFGMSKPIDGEGEELYLYSMKSKTAFGALINDSLDLGVCLSYDTKNLPNMLEWKRMKSHDYVMGIEPCNTCGLNREDAIKENRIAVLPAYSSVETGIEIGILDGREEIESFLVGEKRNKQ